MLIDGTTSCLRRSARFVARLLVAGASLVTATSLAGSTGVLAGTRMPEVSHLPRAASICRTCWRGSVEFHYEASSKALDSHQSETMTVDFTIAVPQNHFVDPGLLKSTDEYPFSVNCPGSTMTIDSTGRLDPHQDFNFEPVATTENGINGYSIGGSPVNFLLDDVSHQTAGTTTSSDCQNKTSTDTSEHLVDVPLFFVPDPHFARALKLSGTKELHEKSSPNSCTPLGIGLFATDEHVRETCNAVLTWRLHRKATH
jgi:hypothetical protein